MREGASLGNLSSKSSTREGGEIVLWKTEMSN